jgi:hypothetical protein
MEKKLLKKIKQEPVEPGMLPEKVLDTGKYKKINKGQTLQNTKRQSYVFSTALLLIEIYLPTTFHVDISYTLRVMSWVNSKCINKHRAITQKLGT